jgi:DNA helicase II / ATP-dependent DNA helicase PcrA
MTHSQYQLNIFDWVKNPNPIKKNLIIEAKAGSGKSSTLLHASTKMSGDVIFLAFNKRISQELEHKLSSMGMPNAKASTIHKEGLGIYTKAKGRVKVNSSKVYFITEKYCQSDTLSPARNFITKLVGFAKQNAFGVKDQTSIDDTQAWMDIISHHDISLDADCDYLTVIEVAKEVLKDSNRDYKNVDFDDMQYLPLMYDVDCKKYDWVLVDEAQDTNIVRKLIVEKILKSNGRAIFVGDKKQSIYGFCGAESNSMELIKSKFDCEELPLSVCYRCAKNIIIEAQKYCPEIEHFPSNPDGEVTSIKYDDFIDKALEIGLGGNDGIVCRNNAPNVALAFALIRKGIGCRIEGKEIGTSLLTLVRRWKRIDDLNVFTEKLTKYFEKEFEKANYAKMQLLEDKLETMCILIERCQDLGKNDLKSLEKLILDMFTDTIDGVTPNVVTLSSIHKAKGLQWNNTYILGQEQFSPSKYANTEHAKEEEQNLIYVSITRAINKLTFITDVPQRGKSNTESL